jgi:hypothetical protein
MNFLSSRHMSFNNVFFDAIQITERFHLCNINTLIGIFANM